MSLPKDLEQAIYSTETFKVLESLWYEHKLSDEQQTNLGSEVGRYMLGKTTEAQFVPNLMYRLDVNRSTAEAIKTKIDTAIIDPIRESFDKAQNTDLFAKSGIEIDEQYEKLTEESDDSTTESDDATANNVTASSVLSDIEDPLHTENTKEEEPDEYSNHSALNVLQEDVRRGIEDPTESSSAYQSEEGTDLDKELDQILKKPRETTASRQAPEPANLPTEDISKQPTFKPTHSDNSQDTPAIDLDAQPKTKPQQNKPLPTVTQYEKDADPYREPIE